MKSIKERYVLLCQGRPGAVDEYVKLLKHPDIAKIQIAKHLTFFTKPIHIEYRGTNYEIGRFKVTFWTESRRDQYGDKLPIKFMNLSRKIQHSYDGNTAYFYHPHIRTHGACLGNADFAIQHLIITGQLAAAFCLCVQYLKSFNSGDRTAPYPSRWPLQKYRVAKRNLKRKR